MFPTGNIARWLAFPRGFFPTFTTTTLLLLALFPARGDARQGPPTAPGAQGASIGIEGEMQPLNVVERDDHAILSPRELIVKFRQGVGRGHRETALAFAASRVEHFADHNHGPQNRPGPAVFDQLVQARLHDGIDPLEAIAELEQNPLVEYAELNFPVHILENFPNDPDFERLWGLYNTGQTGGTAAADIAAPNAWDLSTGSSQVVVAVIDTGIDYTHPDLAENMWVNTGEIPLNGVDDDGNGFIDDIHGYDFYNDDGDPNDDHFHGTHCAGTIGAVGNNGLGVAGVNWDVKLMALKFLGSGGSGNSADAIKAIQYAINHGARVMSNSWGSSVPLQAMQDAITEAYQAGILFVAAAGNSNSDTVFYPAGYEHVMAVAATDHDDRKASFSNFGNYIDVAAPGVGIYSTFPTQRTAAMSGRNTYYDTISGTSMACPHVAGLAALLLGRNSGLDVADLETTLKFTADDLGESGFDLVYGWGRINAYQALQAVNGGDSPVFPEFSILSPRYAEKVSGTLDIAGTASGASFASYVLERSDPALGWVRLNASSTPVVDATLGAWDTREVADGNRGIRLTVTDTAGARYYDYVEVAVNNIETQLTLSNQISGDSPVDIVGTAAVNEGSFSHYTLEVGEGLAPTEWRTERITLANGGDLPVRDGTLGTLDPAGLAPGFYRLRLNVYGSSSSETVDRELYIDPRLRAGFPLRTPGSLLGALGVGDLDGSPASREILLSTSKGSKGFATTGAPLFTLDTDIVYGEAKRIQADGTALGDLDGLPGLEYAYFFKDWGRLHVANQDAFLPPFPLSLPSRDTAHPYTNQVNTMLYDIQGDGELDIIVPTVSYWDDELYLNVLDATGTSLAGFPFVSPYPNVYGIRGAAVGDLDGDQWPEIFFTAHESQSLSHDFVRATLFALDDRGRLLPGFPKDFLPVAGGYVHLGDIHIADLNGDGQKEIVFLETSHNDGADHYRLAVHVLDKAGRALPGWPYILEGTLQEVGYTKPRAGGTLAIGDVTGDAMPELVVMPSLGSSGSLVWAGTAIRVLDGAGQALYRISNIHTNADGVMTAAQPAGLYVVDIDDDGQGEILTARYITLGPGENKLTVLAVLAYRGTEPVAQWVVNRVLDPQTQTLYTPYPGPGIGLAVEDIDGDGTLELVYGADASASSAPGLLTDTVLYAWDLGVPARPQALYWPMVGGNIARTGEYSQASPPSPPPGAGPVADAGADQTVRDGDADGTEAVRLDGRGSYDPDGVIVGYAWSENGRLIASGVTPSVDLTVGTHVITLTVTDDDTPALTDSDAVTIVVTGAADTTPPTVTLTHPQDGATIAKKSTLVVTAAAADDSGTVEKVEIYIDGTLKSADTTAPYEYAWNVPAAKNKTYTLEARAYDGHGNVGVSVAVVVTAQ